MTEPALPSRYRLSMSITHQDGVRTYIAYDHALSRPVLAHLLDTAGPFTPQTMEALLATLPAQDAANIVETAMTERGWAVITLPTDGLNHFVAWLNQRVAAPRTPSPLPPPAPAAPMAPVAPPAPPAGEFTQIFSPGARAATPSVAPRSDVPPVAAQAPYAPMPVPLPPPSTPVWTTPPTIPSAPPRLSDVTLGSSTPEVHTNPAAFPPSAVPVPPVSPPARPAPAAPAAGEFTQMFSPGAVRPAMPAEPRHPSTSPTLPSASAPLPLPLPGAPVAPPPVPSYGSLATPLPPAPVPPPPSQPPMAFPPPASPGAYPPMPAFAPPAAPPPMSQPNSGFAGRGVSSLPPLPPMAAPPSPPFTPPAPVYSPPPPAFTPPPAPTQTPPPFAAQSNQPPASLPPVLPPPLFDLPEAGAAPKRARTAAASDYTMIMNAAVPAVALPSKEGEKPASIAKSPTRLTLPVILIINAVLLLALLLILYFAFRNPPASVPTIKDAKNSADSTRLARTDSGAPRDSNAGGGGATTRP